MLLNDSLSMLVSVNELYYNIGNNEQFASSLYTLTNLKVLYITNDN